VLRSTMSLALPSSGSGRPPGVEVMAGKRSGGRFLSFTAPEQRFLQEEQAEPLDGGQATRAYGTQYIPDLSSTEGAKMPEQELTESGFVIHGEATPF
jgi:hypothetical protein